MQFNSLYKQNRRCRRFETGYGVRFRLYNAGQFEFLPAKQSIMQKDYYQILSVIETAELAVIKATYKTLIHLYHPDRYDGDKAEAHQKTIDILEAYRVLSNPELRDEYDRLWGRNQYGNKPQNTPPPENRQPAKVPKFDLGAIGLQFSGGQSAGNFTEAHEATVKKAAKDGNPDAQIELGRRYFIGHGLNQNHAEAFEWFRKAAEQNNTNAQTILGFMYANGIGVEANEIKAFIWFRRAAEQGDHDAQFRLGLCFYAGFGVAQDYQAALAWLNRASAQANSNAQYLLGFMYAQGEGVAQNINLALGWYRKSAASGNASAQEELNAWVAGMP